MSKTPVSIIQEYCVKQMITPHYDLIHNECGTHNPLFQYRLTVNDISGIGTGKSKKEAKHDAAKTVLKSLLEYEKHNAVLPIGDVAEETETIKSPYQGVVNVNAIGDLAAICLYKTLPEPNYRLIGEVGPAHAKTFTFQCSIANLKVVAESRTKRQAKHICAMLMLNKMKSVLDTELELPEKKPAENELAVDKAAIVTYRMFKKKKHRRYERFGDLPCNSYHNMDLSLYFNLKHGLEERLNNYNEEKDDPYSLLHDLAESRDKTVKINRVDIFASSKTNFVCICEISAPFLITYGSGNTEEESRKNSAHDMICTLKKLLL